MSEYKSQDEFFINALQGHSSDEGNLGSRLVAAIRHLRQSANVSQRGLAARMGTTQSAVCDIESGRTDFRLSTAERLAAALGRAITWRLVPLNAQPTYTASRILTFGIDQYHPVQVLPPDNFFNANSLQQYLGTQPIRPETR